MKTRCRAFGLYGSLVFLVVTQLGCASAAKTQTQQAMTPHVYSASFELSYWGENGRLFFPLWVETPPSREIYRAPEFGLQIERVEVDGRKILSMNISMQWYFCELMLMPVRVDDPFFVYQIKADTWNYTLFKGEKPENWSDYELVNVTRKADNDWDVVAYRIPYDARRIKIEYRLRYPLGGGRDELGPMITVVAERQDNTLMEN